MSDKTFNPPSEEVRAKLLARSGQCERVGPGVGPPSDYWRQPDTVVDVGTKASSSGTAKAGLQLGGVAAIGSVSLDRAARGLIWPLLLSRTDFTSHDGR